MNFSDFFRPKAQPDESAGSILLRLAGAHTERPTAAMQEFGVKSFSVPKTLRQSYIGNENAMSDFCDFTDWQVCELTRSLSNGRMSKNWLALETAKVCPICAKEGYLPSTHDYHLITCCTKHRIELITHCNSCGDQLRWNRYGLLRCHCFEPIQGVYPASDEVVEVCELLEHWILNNEIGKLTAYDSVVTTLKNRISNTIAWEVATVDFINGDSAKLVSALKPFDSEESPLSARALVAVLSQVSSKPVRLTLPQLAIELEQAPSQDSTIPVPDNFYLARSELLFAFGCKPDTVDMLLRNGLKNYPVPGSTRKRYVPLPELNRLYALFAALPPDDTETITLGQLSSLTKIKVWQLVLDLILGKLTPAGSDSWRISDLRVSTPEAYLDAIPDGYSTIDIAKEILGLNAEYLAGFRRSKLLHATKQSNKNNRWIYKNADLHYFQERYVCAPEIGRLVKVPVTEITERLRQIGIYPISGPGIDASKIFVFKRSDLSSLNLATDLNTLKAKSSSGRRKQSAPTLDESVWMNSSEAAEALEVSIQQLFQFVDHDLLHATKAEYSTATEHNHFKRLDVEKVKEYLKNLKAISELAAEIGATKKHVLTRLFRLCKKRPIKIQDNEFIGPDDAEELKNHFSEYWDASQAAQYLNASISDIHNWKRLGHLPALTPHEPGFIEQPTLFKRDIIENFERPGHAYTAK